MEHLLRNVGANVVWILGLLLVIALVAAPFALLLLLLFDDSMMWMDAYFTRQLPAITFFQ